MDAGTQRLIDDLLEKPQSFARDEILTRARRLMYHDYKSPYATPGGVLVKHLTRAGFPDLAERVVNDRYSQKGTGEHIEYEKTPEGREAARITADPGMDEALRKIFDVAKQREAEMRAWLMRCIREKRFEHPVFNDRKVRDRREGN